MPEDNFRRLPAGRHAFLTGFIAAILVCALACVMVFSSGRFKVLAHTAARQAYNKIHPVRIDLEAARNRLRQTAGSVGGGAPLALPLPSPRLVVCQEYRELELFNGERFLKRYKVTLNDAPEGAYRMTAHELPRGSAPLTIGLAPASASAATSATTALTAAPGGGTPGKAGLAIQGLVKPRGGAANGGSPAPPAPLGIGLSEEEAAEIFAATAPGSPVVIEP